jgi:ubiquinone/menaquinone biosynthesis C-methylase UbiE
MKQRIKALFAASDQPNSIGSKFRSRRFKFFEERFIRTFHDYHEIKILDVGGTVNFWKNNSLGSKKNVSITLLNLEKEKSTAGNITSLSGDATDLSCFQNKTFDLVFSNSVIEHLYTFENQTKMAAEVQRVGKHYFVQTPNKYFFLEPHYVFPFFQFIPKKLAYFILTKTKLSRMQKWEPGFASAYLEEIRLLSLGEMKKLFPDADIYMEKFMGLNKSFVFHTLEKK